MSSGDTTKMKCAPTSGDRHRWKTHLTTTQPPSVIAAMNYLARKRNTTVAAIMGEAAIKILEDAREQLPKKLQRQLCNLSLTRPPMGRPRGKRDGSKLQV